MPQLQLPGLSLEYELLQPSQTPRGTLVLIHGLGCQLIQWPQSMLDAFVAAGFRVLRFDNRDVGLSRLENPPKPLAHGLLDLLKWRLGARLDSAYSLDDMVDDTLALMDHLQIDRAHVVGVSMGGMIAQHMALRVPERIQSLTLIMTTSGKRSVGAPRPAVLRSLQTPPRSRDAAGVLAHICRQWQLLQGPAYPSTDEQIREQVQVCMARGMNGAGFARQFQAAMNAPDRVPSLRKLKLPTLVIHGTADPLVHVSGGKSLAAAIPGARLELIEGWGHDWPDKVRPKLTKLILDHAA